MVILGNEVVDEVDATDDSRFRLCLSLSFAIGRPFPVPFKDLERTVLLGGGSSSFDDSLSLIGVA